MNERGSAGPAGFAYVWEFRVRPERAAEFERAYGGEGDWVRLFRRHPGYLGTELLRDRDEPGRYLTVDRWRSAADREAFRDAYRDAIAALDARCEALTDAETPLGELDLVP